MSRLRTMRRAGEGALVGPVVFAETAWVLSSVYRYDRSAIVTAMRGILATPPFVVIHRDAVIAALIGFEKGAADFSDYLILETSRIEGCAKALTFDRRLLKHPWCETP